MKFESYLFDSLMRDLAGHGRSPASYLVYLHLYRHTVAIGRENYAISYSLLADSTGLSKRAVQSAIELLETRKLISIHKERPTSVPIYTVLTPWKRAPQLSA